MLWRCRWGLGAAQRQQHAVRVQASSVQAGGEQADSVQGEQQRSRPARQSGKGAGEGPWAKVLMVW